MEGLLRYHPASGAVRHHDREPESPKSLANDRPVSIAEDRGGTVWMGTFGFDAAGLHRVIPAAEPFPHYVHETEKPNRLSHNGVRALHVDDDGMLWIATSGGGLNRLDLSTDAFTHYRHDPNDPNTLSSDSLFVIYEDRQGTLWIVATDGVLNRFEKATGRVMRYRLDAEEPPDPGAPSVEAVAQWQVTSIAEDRSGALWVGTFGYGLKRFDKGTERWISYWYDGGNPQGLWSNQIAVLLEDRQGMLWIAAAGGGLNRFDPEVERMTRQSSHVVLHLFEDHLGRLWAGTRRDGLLHLSAEGNVQTSLTTADGLPGNDVAAIGEDGSGRLWITTFRGSRPALPVLGRLTQFDPETRRFRTLDEADGLPEVAFHRQSVARDAAGRLYFGGPDGLIAVNPASVADRPPPEVVLTNLRLFNRPVAPGRGAPLREPLHRAEEIRLSHAQNDVTIEYAGLDFSIRSPLRYRYTLENHNDGWVEARTQQSASYSRLHPGRYVFRVQTAREGSGWTEAASIGILVLPPWWRTWWAYLIYGVLVMAGVVAADRIQRRRLIRRERTRAEREAEKLRTEAAEAWANYLQSENERKTQELERARALQLSMLPDGVPDHPVLEIAAFLQTAVEVGGDYYDFHTGREGALTVVIGDATGHGTQAGTMVTAMKSLFSDHAEEPDLTRILHRSARALRRMRLPKLYMALALVRVRGRTLELAGAGMPPALVCRAANGTVEKVSLSGLPLGSPGACPYETRTVTLMPGDTVVLMSDGFPELFGAQKQMLGYERAVNVVRAAAERSAEEMLAHLRKTANAWCNGEAPDVDMTFIVMKVKA